MGAGVRVHDSFAKIDFYLCENRECKNVVIYDAYSWKHVFELGWVVKRAHTFEGGKASGINPSLKADDGTPVELFCPLCGNLLRGR